jgi:ABC-type branched-subunit amino acid transport system ATPase component
VEDVAKHFGGVTAVDGVSFEVRQGEILSIIGPNGAGKTVAPQHGERLLPPDRGRITFEGEDITSFPAVQHRRARHRAHLSEHRTLQGHDRARQPDARAACAHEVGRVLVVRLLGPRAERKRSRTARRSKT